MSQQPLPHVESHWDNNSRTWSDPVLVQDPNIAVHGLSPGLNYGQQAFEGMKAYRTQKGEVRVFRCDRHAARMKHSASYVSIPEVPEEHFTRCVLEAVKVNHAAVPTAVDGGFLYIRPLLFGSGASFVPGPQSSFIMCVFVWPYAPFLGVEPLHALVEEEIDRSATRGFGSAKIGGNYAPFVRWTDSAKRRGYTTSLFLDSKTQSEITEFTHSAFLGIKKTAGSYTIVGTDSKLVVDSITADSCLQIARGLGWNVEVRPIYASELSSFDEVISVGTASSLLPVGSITRETSGEKIVYLSHGEKVGPGTELLSSTMNGIQQGLLEDIYSWSSVVDATIATPTPSVDTPTDLKYVDTEKHAHISDKIIKIDAN